MMFHMTEKKRAGQRYTEEFRAKAIRLLSESSKSARQVAEEIGVNVNSLQAWVKRSKADRGNDGAPDWTIGATVQWLFRQK